MAENYKLLYEQMKNIVVMYQDELVPGFRAKIEELEADNNRLREMWAEATKQLSIEKSKIKHAHWIYKPMEDEDNLCLYYCSKCDTPNAHERNYCQFCGAVMDGDTVRVDLEASKKKVRTINKNNPKNIYCDHCEHYDKSAGVYTGYTCVCKQSKHYLENREYYHRCKQFEWKKDAKYA